VRTFTGAGSEPFAEVEFVAETESFGNFSVSYLG
jgi:hypothetical protein